MDNVINTIMYEREREREREREIEKNIDIVSTFEIVKDIFVNGIVPCTKKQTRFIFFELKRLAFHLVQTRM